MNFSLLSCLKIEEKRIDFDKKALLTHKAVKSRQY